MSRSYLVTRTTSLTVELDGEDLVMQMADGQTDHDSVRMIAASTPSEAWTVDDETIERVAG